MSTLEERVTKLENRAHDWGLLDFFGILGTLTAWIVFVVYLVSRVNPHWFR